ncbi:MAG: hypothetical protein ACR2L1_07685 [Pyrinomonadaceae bacterium]
MIEKNSRSLHKISIGLSLVAGFAIVFALIVGYMKDGEINYFVIAIAAVILSANLMVARKRKTKSEK